MRSREFWSRVPQLVLGLVGVGLGVAMMVDAEVGISPWDVFHQGLHRHTGMSMGTVSILVGLLVFLLWIPLGQRIGAGTALNVLVIGLSINAFLLVPFHPRDTLARYAACVLGVIVISVGGGVYIGAGLGTGPRDGLMTGLVARGYPLRTVRTLLELGVLVIGWVLGGNVGFGTVLFAFTVGPILHFVLHRVDRGVLAPQPVEVEPSFPT
ncbi:MAG: hypothetical protein QOF21_589 [Actinomycetota bacterium]|jgi:uncharacterized membrane protein YczE